MILDYSTELFLYVAPATVILLSESGAECSKHWRLVQPIKVEGSEMLINPLMLFIFRQVKN